MAITSNMSASFYAAMSSAQMGQSIKEASEPASGRDNDGDRDDQVAVQPANSTPAVNAMGETVGQLINVSA